jgi:Zn-dependent metalloprotease
MVPLVHGRAARFLFGLGNVVTFGHYVHREEATAELRQRLELARRVQYHTQFLDQVAKSSPQVEVAWDVATVQKSLKFLADNTLAANGSTAKVAARVFQRSTDDESRKLSLDVLSGINDKTARKEMLRIFREEPPGSDWRVIVAARLRKAVNDADRIKADEANSVMAEIGGGP